MNRTLPIVSSTLLVFATVLESGCSKRSVPETAPPVVSNEQPTRQVEGEETASPIVNAEPAPGKQPLDFSLLPESDLARSSWENPFRLRLWSNDGWRINVDSMTCESDSEQPATFLRPYRSVVIECRFSRATEIETKTAAEENLPIDCEIRLLSRDSNRWASLSLSSASITLTESVDGANATVRTLRETDRITGDGPSDVKLRLTLTPNRLLVAVDGQMKINVARPGSIMMTDCLAQFIASKADIELSDLRFEGD
ncbi:MAG: hypothetical protein ACI8P0_001427 [Planctomycetaceae bacterium]|jgi:hypothetical protein